MFRVHDDQVKELARQRRTAFEARLSNALADRHPDGTRGPAFVGASVERALARRIGTEPEVAQYVWIESLCGGDLAEAFPYCAVVLEDEHLTSLGKVRVLLRTLVLHGVRGAEAVDLHIKSSTA